MITIIHDGAKYQIPTNPAEVDTLKLEWFKKGIYAMLDQSLIRYEHNNNDEQVEKLYDDHREALRLANDGTIGPLKKEG